MSNIYPHGKQSKVMGGVKFETVHQLMTVERIHPKAPVMLIFIAIFTCLPSSINLSNIDPINTMISTMVHDV